MEKATDRLTGERVRSDHFVVADEEVDAILAMRVRISEVVEHGSAKRSTVVKSLAQCEEEEEEEEAAAAAAAVASGAARPEIWPEWLSDDQSYEVIKVNSVRRNGHSRADPRCLRLDREGLQNMKKKGGLIRSLGMSAKDERELVATRMHAYHEVAAVYLTARDRLVIEFYDAGSQTIEYSTPVAPQIVAQITARVSAHQLHAQCRRVGRGVPCLTPERAAELAREYSQGKGYKPRARVGTANQDAEASILERSFPSMEQSTADQDAAVEMSAARSVEAPPRYASRRARKLESITGESEHNRIRVTLAQTLADTTTPEGRTLAHFVARFRAQPGGGAAAVRNFVDGLHQYMLATHETAYKKLCVDTSVGLDEDDALRESAGDAAADAAADAAIGIAGSAQVTLATLLLQAIERAVLVPLDACLGRAFQKVVPRAQETELFARFRALRAWPQTEFGLDASLVSPHGWSAAVCELERMDRLAFPSQKLGALVGAAKLVYHEHQSRGTDRVLAADEFLPIFIFVVVHAELAAPLLTREQLWRLGHPRALQAEPGYYLTMFDAGIEYVRSLDLGHGPAAPMPLGKPG